MPDAGCPEIEDLERFVLQSLDAPAADRLRAHLTACAECAEMLRDLEENLKLESAIKHHASSGESFAPAEPELKQVGPFRIVRKLGQGGMGSVYEAEQDNPRRSVALKVIRPGLISRALLSRFRQESQVLGRLRHVGIAQIYQAGTHQPDGGAPQPYFAMEFVNGPPLLRYAHAHSLDRSQRLELLAKVCDAVQHAHQRGVIHRDLKPDNILVDDAGGAAQPKILDFGVARVIDPDTTQATLNTSAGQIVGTVAYMSPEQASGDPSEIDTRSDVYALGVIAYQLLTGRMPYKLSQASIAESVRTIVQDDAAPLSSIDRSLRGDATTIVGKALSKEKSRRYQSAAEMAADIRRHLRDEPISAHPPSTIYQLGKFARRNKGLVAGIAAAFVVLVAGVIGTSIGLYRAQRARAAADQSAAQARLEADRQQAVNQFLQGMLQSANPRNLSAVDKNKGREVTVVQAIEAAAAKLDAGELKDQPEIEIAVRLSLGVTLSELGESVQAEHHLARGLALARQHLGPVNRSVAEFLNSLAICKRGQGKPLETEQIAREALEVSEKLYGKDAPEVGTCLNTLALALQDLGRLTEAEPLLQRILELRLRQFGEESREVATSLNNLAMALDQRGKLDEAEPLYRRALATRIELLGETHPDVAVVMNNLGFVLRSTGRAPESVELFRKSLEIRRALLGDDHPMVASALNNLGSVLQQLKRYADAEPLYVQAINLQRKNLGNEHPALASSINNLATLRREEGKFDEALELFGQSLDIRRKVLGPRHPALAVGLSNMASILHERGEAAKAVEMCREAVAIATERFGAGNVETAGHRAMLGRCLISAGDFPAAEIELLAAYDILKGNPPATDRRLLTTLRYLQSLYQAWNKPQEAARYAAMLPATQPVTSGR